MNKMFARILMFVIVMVAGLLVVNAWLAHHNIRQIRSESILASRTRDVLIAIETIMSLAKDAETGQRGYLITGETSYLEPYNIALANIDKQVKTLEQLTADNPTQQARIPALKNRIADRLKILQEGLALRKENGFEAAREMILTGRGKNEMDELRRQIDEMVNLQKQLREAALQRSAHAYNVAVSSSLIADLFALAMVVAFIFLFRRYLLSRDTAAAAIHEQREMFRTTLASIGDAVMTTDTQGNVTYLNSVAESLTGWTQEAATGQPLETVFHIVNEQTHASVEKPVTRVLRQGVIVGLGNHTVLISKDGTERPIDDSAAPIRDRNGKTIGVVMVFRDVAERRRAENALRENEEKLRQQAQELEQQLIASGRLVSLGEITASMAHEFNNPLGIVMGFAEDLLSETDPSSPQHRSLQIINEEARRCQKIIQELLEFSRPKNADFSLTDIMQIVEKTLNLVTNHLYKQKIEAGTVMEENLPKIYADPQQLEQVLVNLYLNAIDAMPEGGKLIIGARIEPVDGSPLMVLITVADTGFGIEATDLSKIFHPFFSAKKGRGMGLGLSITERIVKNHGGRIEVESQPGTGTTFRIHLPLNRKESSEDFALRTNEEDERLKI